MSKIVKYNEFKKVIDALWDKVKGTFVTEVNYDTNGSILKYVKNGSETEITKVVTEWKDLEYTTQSSLKNIFDKNTQVEDNKRYYYDHIQENQDWKIAKIPCQAGDEFTIIKNDRNDSSQIGLFEAGDIHIQSASSTYQLVKGRMVYHLTIPNSVNNVSYFVTSMQKNTTNVDEVMIFKENVADNDIPTKYIPFSGGAEVLINSNNVALSFDNNGTQLTSSTIHSAIKELGAKVNTGGITNIEIDNVTGLRDELDNKVDNSRVGNEANKIPVIDGGGKLATSIIPDLAITDVFVVANEQEMMRLTVQKGDVVVVENGAQHQNQTFMCKNDTATAQNDKFIAINMGYPVVKKVNGLSPSNVGELTINASQINATVESNTKTVEKHLTDIGQNLRTTHNIATAYNPRINKLEGRRATTRIGEVIKVWTTNSNDYADDGCTFIYLGRNNTISANDYPDLARAWGISAGARFTLPRMNDATIRYDNSTKSVPEKYFLCVKKS